MVGIYKFQNKKNNKIYIGQSNNIPRRFYEHLFRNEQIIDKAIKKHGIVNFDFQIIEECSIDELNQKESYWIEYYQSKIPYGYNVKDSTGAVRGESNGQSKLKDEDIFFIRTCYREKIYKTSAELWKENYKHLNQGTIESVFFGKSWTHLMMDVYTEDLKNYYKEQYLKTAIGGRHRKGENNPMSILSEKDVINMRVLYQTKSRQEIFEKYPNYSHRAIVSIISGQN